LETSVRLDQEFTHVRAPIRFLRESTDSR
jgi:hypothetical protein